MNDSESYLEKCIAALPPEKHEAARRAFREIAETGDDSYLSKLLVILEANNAYAVSIPLQLTAFGDQFMQGLCALVETQAREEALRESKRGESLKKVIEAQMPELGKSLSLGKVATAIEGQTVALTQLKREVARMRHARISGLIALMALGMLVGVGATIGLFWQKYADARQDQAFIDRIYETGVRLKIARIEGHPVLSVDGPTMLKGTTMRANVDGFVTGATFVLPKEGNR
jgi:Flp pilus assembly pilin Flp